jgi:ribonuclease P protein component
MLPLENRLKKKSAFNATYRSGISFHKNGITVFCGKKKFGDYPTKIGFVVSKKVHKRAVRRNRMKRLMRESLRLYIKQNGNNLPYMSLIFTGSTKLLDKNFSDIDSTIKKIMEKIAHD